MSMSWAVVVRLGVSCDLEPSVWLPPLRYLWKEPHCVNDFLLSSLSLLILFPLLSFFFSSWWTSVSHLVWDHHKCFTVSTLHENCLLMLRAWCAVLGDTFKSLLSLSRSEGLVYFLWDWIWKKYQVDSEVLGGRHICGCEWPWKQMTRDIVKPS